MEYILPLTVGDEGPQHEGEAEAVEVVVVVELLVEEEEDATSECEWVLPLLPFVAGPTPTTSISSSSSGSTAVQFVLPASEAAGDPGQGTLIIVVVALASESLEGL